MRSPQDTRFQKIQDLMKTGQMVGKDRPVGRVTWAKGSVLAVDSAKSGMGLLRFLDKSAPEYEVPNVRVIDIQRSIGQDSATATITMYNARADSTKPEGVDTAGTAGYLTPGRGEGRAIQTSVYTTLEASDDVFGNVRVNYPTDWQYSVNPYRDVFVPNTILRTYQGYGSDNFDETGNPRAISDPGYVAPGDDSALYVTGVWLIDKVTFMADGTMNIECRDMAKLLIEQFIYPPMIPIERFPLIYCPAHDASGQHESIGKNVASFHSSSVDLKHGSNAPILGHRGSDAFDGRNETFWLSGASNNAADMEYLQASLTGPVNEISIFTFGGNYRVYISVHENGQWQGTQTVTGISENLSWHEGTGAGSGGGAAAGIYVVVPGDTLWAIAGRYYGNNFLWPRIAEANSNIIKDPHWIYPGQRLFIPYIPGTKLSPPPVDPSGYQGTAGTTVSIPYEMTTTIPANGIATIALPRTYNADFIRLTFTNLQELVDGTVLRAGVAELVVRNHIPETFVPSTIGVSGYIQDWVEPIKEMVSWAGLTWVNPPKPTPTDAVLGKTSSDDPDLTKVLVSKGNVYPTGSRGPLDYEPPNVSTLTNVPVRAWGDFEVLGTGPIVCTPADYFLSKSFMDGIRQIVDFIGGIFYVDEGGGAQFRLPNIWSGGNFIDDSSALPSLDARMSAHPIEFHEDANLVSYSMTISDESLRSEILVIGGQPDTNMSSPVAGGYVLGYNSATGTTSAIDFSDVLAGQYRLMVVPGDSTKLFYTEQECQRMAELTALFILFTYRQGQLDAPAHPGLQIDDQVRIYERITNEQNIHYVSSLSTHMDLEGGEYTMSATTHWLGTDPDTDWFVNKQQLTPAVLGLPAIIARIGRNAAGGAFEQMPYS